MSIDDSFTDIQVFYTVNLLKCVLISQMVHIIFSLEDVAYMVSKDYCKSCCLSGSCSLMFFSYLTRICGRNRLCLLISRSEPELMLGCQYQNQMFCFFLIPEVLKIIHVSSIQWFLQNHGKIVFLIESFDDIVDCRGGDIQF